MPDPCGDLWDDVELAATEGAVIIPDYKFMIDLDFTQSMVGIAEVCTLAVNFSSNFYSGLITGDNGDLYLLIRHDENGNQIFVYEVDTSVSTYCDEYYKCRQMQGQTKVGSSASLPRQFDLRQNYPNPFNPVTVISFDLPEACDVRLEIYNILGQKVESLVNDHLDAGTYSIIWDSRNSHVPSGVYFYKIQAGTHVDSRKMLLLK